MWSDFPKGTVAVLGISCQLTIEKQRIDMSQNGKSKYKP